jgi:hypothetical protein
MQEESTPAACRGFEAGVKRARTPAAEVPAAEMLAAGTRAAGNVRRARR